MHHNETPTKGTIMLQICLYAIAIIIAGGTLAYYSTPPID